VQLRCDGKRKSRKAAHTHAHTHAHACHSAPATVRLPPPPRTIFAQKAFMQISGKALSHSRYTLYRLEMHAPLLFASPSLFLLHQGPGPSPAALLLTCLHLAFSGHDARFLSPIRHLLGGPAASSKCALNYYYLRAYLPSTRPPKPLKEG
jgi:hypothetical protein